MFSTIINETKAEAESRQMSIIVINKTVLDYFNTLPTKFKIDENLH